MSQREKSQGKHAELNKNITPNLSGTGKAVHKGNFITLNACVRREERSQMNNLILHLKKLEKMSKITQN